MRIDTSDMGTDETFSGGWGRELLGVLVHDHEASISFAQNALLVAGVELGVASFAFIRAMT